MIAKVHRNSGAAIEFVDIEIEALKEKIAEKLCYDLVDHCMELYTRALELNACGQFQRKNLR